MEARIDRSFGGGNGGFRPTTEIARGHPYKRTRELTRSLGNSGLLVYTTQFGINNENGKSETLSMDWLVYWYLAITTFITFLIDKIRTVQVPREYAVASTKAEKCRERK